MLTDRDFCCVNWNLIAYNWQLISNENFSELLVVWFVHSASRVVYLHIETIFLLEIL